MANKTKLLISTISLFLFIGVVSSCSPKAEKTMSVKDPQTGEKVDVTVSEELFSKDKEINIKNEKEGTSLKISQGEIPNSMPSYIEPYPGAAELTSVQATGKEVNKDGKVNMISFKSKDAPVKIIEFYEGKLAQHGFKKEASANFGPMQMATLANDQTKQALQLMITQEPNKDSMVQLIFADKK